MPKFNEILTSNASYKSRQITASAIGTFAFDAWDLATARLNRECYRVASTAFNRGFTAEPSTVEMRPVYAALRDCFRYLDPVNGVNLYDIEVDASTGALVYGLAYELKAKKSETLKAAQSALSTANKLLKEAREANEEEDEIRRLSADVDEAERTVKHILNQPDEHFNEFVPVDDKKFRKAFEDVLGNMIKGVQALTADEVQAKIDAKKEERKARNAAKKAAKKANAKKSA